MVGSERDRLCSGWNDTTKAQNKMDQKRAEKKKLKETLDRHGLDHQS